MGSWSKSADKTISYDGFDGWKAASLEPVGQPQDGLRARGWVQKTINHVRLYGEVRVQERGRHLLDARAVGERAQAPGAQPGETVGIGLRRKHVPLPVRGSRSDVAVFRRRGDRAGGLPVRLFPAMDRRECADTGGPRSTIRTSDTAKYVIQWEFPEFARLRVPVHVPVRHHQPVRGTRTYTFDGAANAYPAWINQPPERTLPPFLGSSSRSAVVKYCANDGSLGDYPCGTGRGHLHNTGWTEWLWTGRGREHDELEDAAVREQVEVPQLCAPINGATPTAKDQPFESWIDDTIPNPSLPSTGRPRRRRR